MNTESIISLAREAGGQTGWDSEQLRQDPLLSDTDFVFDMESLERFAGIVIAAERERAALVCDGTQASFEERAQGSQGPYNEMSVGAQCCAAAIRGGK